MKLKYLLKKSFFEYDNLLFKYFGKIVNDKRILFYRWKLLSTSSVYKNWINCKMFQFCTGLAIFAFYLEVELYHF
jgi:hypothetical protein